MNNNFIVLTLAITLALAGATTTLKEEAGDTTTTLKEEAGAATTTTPRKEAGDTISIYQVKLNVTISMQL